ncbi:MAG: PQQ-dependent sugar dehydrogenase [Rhodothermales bacterium]|nr:PQQ-dependent sugar dehydrogenase [Rhodothermales bacterium]
MKTPTLGAAAWLSLLLAGCSGPTPSRTASTERPDDNRFTPVVLAQGASMDEPMSFEVLDDGTVFFIERKGGVKRYDPGSNAVMTVAMIPVNTKYTNAEGVVREAEEGLVGMTVHPDFEQKPWIYLLYADPAEPKHVLARWDYRDGALDEATKKVVLEYPVQREACCHTGGGMTWDADGNLFMTIGNNTGNSQMSQTDERPARSSWDDQRGASNTNDLRGKIIRIHPEDDGTYTIPDGNLFAPGTPNTRPEIYTMGHRNAWRVSIDSETGYIYWGEVGPDASEDTEIGPRGYDEMNQAKGAGYFGWPYFIGENHAFPFYDFAADSALAPKDPLKPINTSVNNTGLQELPPAQPAFISYPYGVSERFPDVGTGGRSATGGPIYRAVDFAGAARPFPDYFEGKWIMADLSRGWIMAVTMDANSDYVSMERFMPDYKPAEIIDIKFGPEGDLYVLEYGSRWFADSEDDKLVRIEYNAGNRTPHVVAGASTSGGKVPFDVVLSAEGTQDFDGDELTYRWEVAPLAGGASRTLEGPAPTVSFDQAGVYVATLEVSDPAGATNSASVQIVAGNEPPRIDVRLASNTSFFFQGKPVDYTVTASDTEDGTVDAAAVAVSIDYASEGFDYAEVIQGQRSVDASTRFAVAKVLISKTDCGVCHQPEVRSAGPSYAEIADKYRGDAGAKSRLAEKVRGGGGGVWGEIVMPAHPGLTSADAATIVDYILNYGDKTIRTLPLSDQFVPVLPADDNGRGSLLVRAAYTDRGAGDVPALTAEKLIVLRSPILYAGDAEIMQGARKSVGNRGAGPMIVQPNTGGHLAFQGIDLTGVTRVDLAATARTREGTVGGNVEVRLGSPTGALLGQDSVEVTEFRFGAPPTATAIQQAGGAAQAAAAQGGGGRRQQGPQGVQIAVQPTTGVHDLYLVFKNDAARDIDPLMNLTAVTLVAE